MCRRTRSVCNDSRVRERSRVCSAHVFQVRCRSVNALLVRRARNERCAISKQCNKEITCKKTLAAKSVQRKQGRSKEPTWGRGAVVASEAEHPCYMPGTPSDLLPFNRRRQGYAASCIGGGSRAVEAWKHHIRGRSPAPRYLASAVLRRARHRHFSR
jgi:hypothetical protein